MVESWRGSRIGGRAQHMMGGMVTDPAPIPSGVHADPLAIPAKRPQSRRMILTGEVLPAAPRALVVRAADAAQIASLSVDALTAGTPSPTLPPVRQPYDPDHVPDHNLIRDALSWVIARVSATSGGGGTGGTTDVMWE